MIPLEEAQQRVLEPCSPLVPRRVRVVEALGCVLAEAVRARQAVPPFANTAMDGYAVRASDTQGAPVLLEVLGTLPAGGTADVEVSPGQAVRIMTGAPIPRGADAIAKVEITSPAGDERGGKVLVKERVRPGEHVRRAGEDLVAGSEVFAPGTELGPGHLGVLAGLGETDVAVVPRPAVGVMSCGDELVEGPGELPPGKIRDSNRHALLGLVRENGFDALDLGIAPDDEAAISSMLEEGLTRCDAILTSGGVSVGDFDYVKSSLERLGAGSASWMQVAIKPAKPLAFGTVGAKPVFGLPGNPVSSMVSFELFARPALRKMAGHAQLHRPRLGAVTDAALPRARDGKLHLLRVTATVGEDGLFHVRPSGGQGSHMLRAMAGSNALALVPDGEGVAAGEQVRIILLRA